MEGGREERREGKRGGEGEGREKRGRGRRGRERGRKERGEGEGGEREVRGEGSHCWPGPPQAPSRRGRRVGW